MACQSFIISQPLTIIVEAIILNCPIFAWHALPLKFESYLIAFNGRNTIIQPRLYDDITTSQKHENTVISYLRLPQNP